MESELQRQVSSARSKNSREMEFASLSYDALKRCDYVRAHIAARFCLQVNSKSVEGAAALAVAAGALGQVQQVHQALNFLGRTTGMVTPGILWGAGWSLISCGDWVPAEAFLEKLCASKQKHPTHLMLLALCQSKRGKIQSALLTARQACTQVPVKKEEAKFFIDLLLQAGYLREAEARLKLLEAEAGDDIDIMLLMVRVHLLLRTFATADKWTEQMRGKQAGAQYFVRLGQYHELARQNQKAFGFYNEALAAGFFPEGLLGLARLETLERNKDLARRNLIAALNTSKELGEKAVGPLSLFHEIINQLLALQDPVPNCRAWIASLNGGKSPPGLANRALLIYASDQQQAERYLNELTAAMQPGTPPILPSQLGWKQAEKEKQPDGPVRAGIQCVLD
jgi:Tfp pilus assembly protein PilF